MATEKPHLLIVEARFYEGLSEALLDGATTALEQEAHLLAHNYLTD